MKRDDNAREGNSCCEWRTFIEGFDEAYEKWFDAPPNARAKSNALRDWRAGNTGWEAAHNAQRRAKERAHRPPKPKLVWCGGRNYAAEGSAFAIKYGKPSAAASVNPEPAPAESTGEAG